MKKWHSKRFAHCYCYERNGIVYLSLFGQKVRKSTNLKWTPENKDIALKILDKSCEKYEVQGLDNEVTLNDLVAKFENYKYINVDSKYKRKIKSALDRFLTDRSLSINNISEIELMIFNNVKNTIKLGNSINGIKKQLQFVEQLFNFGIKRNIIKVNPAKLVNDELKATKIDREAFPEQYIPNLLDDLKVNNEKAYYGVQLALYTGMRIQEIVSLKRSDIDFNKNLMTIHGKGDNIRQFTLTGRFKNVRELLKEILEQSYDDIYLFGWNHVGTPQKAFRSVCKRLNIYKRGRNFHSLRKNFINQLADENYPLRAASDLVGHTIRVMEKYYLKRTDAKKQAEISQRHENYISQK